MLYPRLLFFYSIILFFPGLCTPASQSLLVLDNGELHFKALEQVVEKPLLVNSVTYQSDVIFKKDEFKYLVEIEPNQYCSLEQLKKAFSYLKKKNKFQTIYLELNPVNSGWNLHFTFAGFWTFYKVKFEGVFVGRDAYRHLYTMEQGEQFDSNKHRHFIGLIKQALHADGFFNAQVLDYFKYNKRTKSVTVNVCLVPNTRFTIDRVNIDLVYDGTNDELHHIKKKINERWIKKLSGTRYLKTVVNNETHVMKSYLSKKGFLNAAIELQMNEKTDLCTVDLHYKIKLTNQRRFIFFGNHFFSKKELIEHCASFGRSADLVPLSIIVEELIEWYHVKGFWQVTIDPQIENGKCFFMINEGVRSYIAQVKIDGCTYLSAHAIQNKFLRAYKKKKPFDLDVIKNKLSELEEWYAHEGFKDISIDAPRFEQIGDSHDYQLIINVHEGIRKFINSITVEGLPDSQVCSLFKDEPLSTPYSQKKINDQKAKLYDYFQRHGYLSAHAKAHLSECADKIDITWKIQADARTQFGKTIVQGSSSLPFGLIRKATLFKKGEWWDKQKVRDTFLHFRDLEVFETIYAQADFMQEGDQRDVLLKLVRDDPFEIRIRAGFQQVSKNFTFRNGTTYRVGGSLLIKNPFNYADLLRLDVDITRFYHNVEGLYTRPWFLGFPIQLILKGYNNTYFQPVMLGLARPLYQARQQGGMIGLAHRSLKRQWGINSGIELMETNHLSIELARAINFQPLLIDRLVPYWYLEPNFFIDRLDDKLNPKRGMLTVITCKGMVPFDKFGVFFFKFLWDQAFFRPLWYTVLAFHLKCGYIWGKKFENIMPIDRFYLGGENSLRGYMPDLAPPLGIYTDEHEHTRLVPQGGRFVFNSTLEVRFPIYKQLWGAVFEDIGILVADEPMSTIINGNNLLGSTGFGLRYMTPIGPLRFDIGFKWRKRDPEDSIAAWFLTLGHAF